MQAANCQPCRTFPHFHLYHVYEYEVGERISSPWLTGFVQWPFIAHQNNVFCPPWNKTMNLPKRKKENRPTQSVPKNTKPNIVLCILCGMHWIWLTDLNKLINKIWAKMCSLNPSF